MSPSGSELSFTGLRLVLFEFSPGSSVLLGGSESLHLRGLPLAFSFLASAFLAREKVSFDIALLRAVFSSSLDALLSWID